MEEIKTIEQAKEFLNKLLEKPNGARPYEDYINTVLAGDFSVDISKIIISKLKIKDETISDLEPYHPMYDPNNK